VEAARSIVAIGAGVSQVSVLLHRLGWYWHRQMCCTQMCAHPSTVIQCVVTPDSPAQKKERFHEQWQATMLRKHRGTCGNTRPLWDKGEKNLRVRASQRRADVTLVACQQLAVASPLSFLLLTLLVLRLLPPVAPACSEVMRPSDIESLGLRTMSPSERGIACSTII